jgi:threonine dehydrogenase-like Zn-dependent dehydrogenase
MRNQAGYRFLGVVMLALVFEPSPSRVSVAGALSMVRPWLALRGRGPLFMKEMVEGPRPQSDWVRLRVVVTGICGSDVKQATLQASSDNPLSALVTFPHVPGHEIVAELAEPRPDLGLEEGSPVAVDPWLGCVARGLANPCPACSAGFPPHCSQVLAGGPWGPGHGMHLGTVRGLPGGFAQIIHAHRTQLHVLPPGLPLETAVLADPLAVAMHAVAQVPDEPAGPVLVLGAGTIGLGLALAARERWPLADISVTCAWPHQTELVRNLGARPIAPQGLVSQVAELAGSRVARPWRGGPWTIGAGADVVLDSIGSAATTEQALRVISGRGTLVTVGVGRPARSETTLAYYKEVRQLGSNGYGRHNGVATCPHLLDSALELLRGRQSLVSGWLTHTFPIRRWREAFETAARPERSGAIKVTLRLWED